MDDLYEIQKKNNGFKCRTIKKSVKRDSRQYARFTADHDHSEFETNGRAGHAELKNQKNAEQYQKEYLDKNDFFKIKGNYFVIKV